MKAQGLVGEQIQGYFIAARVHPLAAFLPTFILMFAFLILDDSPTVVRLLNDGSGDFSETGIQYAATGPGGNAIQLTANDFDQDGKTDIAVLQGPNGITEDERKYGG